jgi:ABC-type transporter Mla subunit MlaD
MKAANLRVLTPAGFDLFPYLDMDDTDRQSIVAAFVDTAVWGVKQICPEGVGKKSLSKSELTALREKIKYSPEAYLYFILSPEPITHGRGKTPRLEGLVIHESEFNDFDFRFQNLGIHFAATDKEHNIAQADLEETIVANVMKSFDHSAKRLETSLEKAFNKERKRLKDRIEQFNEFVEDKKAIIAKTKKALNGSIAKIKEKENAINAYNEYLEKRVRELSKIMDQNRQGFYSFFNDVSEIAMSVSADLNKIFASHIERFEDKIKSLNVLHKKANETNKAVKKLLETKEQTSKAYNELKAFEKKFSAEIDQAQWQCLGLQDNIQKMWTLGDACRGLHEMMAQVERYILEMIAVEQKADVSMAARKSGVDWQWLYQEQLRMERLVSDSISLDDNSQKIKNFLFSMENPVRKAIDEIENAVGELKVERQRSRDNRELYQSVNVHLRNLQQILHYR